jgi:hypothetical protein
LGGQAIRGDGRSFLLDRLVYLNSRQVSPIGKQVFQVAIGYFHGKRTFPAALRLPREKLRVFNGRAKQDENRRNDRDHDYDCASAFLKCVASVHNYWVKASAVR